MARRREGPIIDTRLDISIDRSSPVPLYHQVVTAIETAIRDGQLAPGTRIDNEVEFANQLNVSRPTMRKAMSELVRQGLVVRKRGIGTQVISNHMRRPLELSSLFDDLVRTGKKPKTQVLEFTHLPAEADILETLGLPEGASVYYFKRLRFADGRPLAIMRNWVREDIATFTEAELIEGGMYHRMRLAGVTFKLAYQRMGATVAKAEESELLEVELGAPLITMERTTLDDMGRVVEAGTHLYRADSYSFEVTLIQH